MILCLFFKFVHLCLIKSKYSIFVQQYPQHTDKKNIPVYVYKTEDVFGQVF